MTLGNAMRVPSENHASVQCVASVRTGKACDSTLYGRKVYEIGRSAVK